MELSSEIRAWVEQLTEGEITSVDHQGRWRDQFFVDVRQTNGNTLKLLVRFPRRATIVQSSRFLSNYDITHEAAILRELQDVDVLIPKFFGYNVETPAILMERLDGSPDMTTVGDEARHFIMREYIENLVKLHSLEFDTRHFPPTALPDTPRKKTLGSLLVFMEQDYKAVRLNLKPEPLLDFALWWLEQNAPRSTAIRLIQGDTGPGQFLAHDGHLVALIDWELCHFGDPMTDLGVMRMRNMLYPVGELRPYLDYYSELTREPIDRESLCFQTVSAMLQSPLGIAASVQTPDPAIQSMIPRLGWDVTLRRGLCDALCEAVGIEVDPPDLPQESPDERSDLTCFLAAYLDTACSPIAKNDYDRYLMRGAIGVARSVERIHQVGQQLEREDLLDMEMILGESPSTREHGLKMLQALISLDPQNHVKNMLWLFSRLERRREYLWAPMMIAQQSRPFERIYPALERYIPSTEAIVTSAACASRDSVYVALAILVRA